LPASAAYPSPAELWAPRRIDDDMRADRSGGYMYAVARLAAGATPASAQAELDRIARVLGDEFPSTNATAHVTVLALERHLLGDVRPALLVLLGAVLFVLLIACANVAALLL